MCTLALFRDVSPRYPLVIAANRDEYLDRPALPPALLADPLGVVAGSDLEAGGTWLGCRVEGGALVAGLLNRRLAAPSPSAPPSSCGLAASFVSMPTLRLCRSKRWPGSTARDSTDYAPFNLL